MECLGQSAAIHAEAVFDQDSLKMNHLRKSSATCIPVIQVVMGDCKADVIFVLDSSDSYGVLNWFNIKQFIMDIVQGLKVGENQTRIGMISYSTMVRSDFYLGQYFETSVILPLIWASDYMAGMTNTADGIDEMRQMFRQHKRADVKQIAILVTDGKSNLNQEFTIQNAEAAEADGIDIFVVGLGEAVDQEEIAAIATDPSFIYDVTSFDTVNGVAQSINNMTCHVYDCYLCDFTKGQIWLPDRQNCHMFYVCEPIGYLKYRKHHMTCGELWWQQDIHTCVRSPPEGCDVTVDVVTYAAPSTSEVTLYFLPIAAPCPYEPVPNQVGYFRSIDSPNEIQQCVQGMVFQDPPCECVQVGEIIPTCSDDLLLYFPYEDHYNDVTCHHAIATQHGTDVSRVFDSERRGNVACFGGQTHFEVAFLRTWFAENNVDQFSIAVWFQRPGDLSPKAAIVNNRNCRQSAGFRLSCANSEVTASVTANSELVLDPAPMANDNWNHAAWVYDGSSLKLYLNGVLTRSDSVSGFMQNNDVPMHIANNCDDDYFVGCLDELRVYDRALSQSDIDELRTLLPVTAHKQPMTRLPS
ncbi:hypothetical protein LSAT2_009633 [Lamellibrachia satsuma]|nr:hypothetical protein LSAT2_009633 [Lamellibrachia satsuma]